MTDWREDPAFSEQKKAVKIENYDMYILLIDKYITTLNSLQNVSTEPALKLCNEWRNAVDAGDGGWAKRNKARFEAALEQAGLTLDMQKLLSGAELRKAALETMECKAELPNIRRLDGIKKK